MSTPTPLHSHRMRAGRLSAVVCAVGLAVSALPPVAALFGGRPDVNDAAANAVVYVTTPSVVCTGGLIAPDLVLTAGHCLSAANRAVPPAGATGDWENPRTWFSVRGVVRVAVGNNRLAPMRARQVTRYTIPGGADIVLLRLDVPIDPSVAIPMPAVTRVGTDAGALAGWALRREVFRIGGFGVTDFADAGPLPALRQVGSAAFFAANRCHSYVDGPGAGATETVLRGGDSGSPLIVEVGGRRLTVGAAQGYGPDPASPEICGGIPVSFSELSRYTPTFRTKLFTPERTSIAEWLEAMAPAAVLAWPKGDVPLVGDMDFIRGAELVVHDLGTGFWQARDLTGGWVVPYRQWGGAPFDRPLVGNVAGDSREDYVIYRPAGGYWYAKDTSDAVHFRDVQWGGEAGDVPLLADVDGDGLDEVLIYRPTNGRWFARNPRTGVVVFRNRLWGGVPGDLPLAGDVDGDGDEDLVIYRRTTGRWYAQGARDGGTLVRDVEWGTPGDMPFLANVDDDPEVEFVIYRPVHRTWFARDAGGAVVFRDVFRGGRNGDVPLVADVNGDGQADLISYRPDSAAFFGADWRTGEIFGDVRIGTPR